MIYATIKQKGGSGNLGIAEFDGNLPASHVATMLNYEAWQPCKPEEIPCKCIEMAGVILSNGCPRHDADFDAARFAQPMALPGGATMPAMR
jgi:hypothetical protein